MSSNRAAATDTETRALARPRFLRDWRDSIEELETVDAAAPTAAAAALEVCYSRIPLSSNDFLLRVLFVVFRPCPDQG